MTDLMQLGDPVILAVNKINLLTEKIVSLYIKSKEGRIVGGTSNTPLDTVYEDSELQLFESEIALLRTSLQTEINNFPVITLIPATPGPDIII
jgi:hypothetical protein